MRFHPLIKRMDRDSFRARGTRPLVTRWLTVRSRCKVSKKWRFLILFLNLSQVHVENGSEVEKKAHNQTEEVLFFIRSYFGSVTFTRGRCPGSKAPYFNTLDTYATVPNINIPDCDFTVACWIRVLPIGRGAAFAAVFWSVSASGNLLYFTLSKYHGGVSFGLKQMLRPLNYTNVITTTRKIPYGNWTHITATCRGNRIGMYVNGDHQRSNSENIPFSITEDFSTDMSSEELKSYYIGKDPRKEFSSSRKFHGSVMDLHVIGVALSSVEVSYLYRGKIDWLLYVFKANSNWLQKHAYQRSWRMLIVSLEIVPRMAYTGDLRLKGAPF